MFDEVVLVTSVGTDVYGGNGGATAALVSGVGATGCMDGV